MLQAPDPSPINWKCRSLISQNLKVWEMNTFEKSTVAFELSKCPQQPRWQIRQSTVDCQDSPKSYFSAHVTLKESSSVLRKQISWKIWWQYKLSRLIPFFADVSGGPLVVKASHRIKKTIWAWLSRGRPANRRVQALEVSESRTLQSSFNNSKSQEHRKSPESNHWSQNYEISTKKTSCLFRKSQSSAVTSSRTLASRSGKTSYSQLNCVSSAWIQATQ